MKACILGELAAAAGPVLWSPAHTTKQEPVLHHAATSTLPRIERSAREAWMAVQALEGVGTLSLDVWVGVSAALVIQ